MHDSLPNTIDYIEMPSRDIAGTKRFFAALFGWSFVDYGPDYASFDDGRMAGGFFASGKTANVDAGAPLIVFYHGELEKMKTKVVDLSGKITKKFSIFPVAGVFIFVSRAAASSPFGRTSRMPILHDSCSFRGY